LQFAKICRTVKTTLAQWEKISRFEAGPGIMNVMIIKPYRSPKGTIRLRKKMVKVKDLSEIDAIAANL